MKLHQIGRYINDDKWRFSGIFSSELLYRIRKYMQPKNLFTTYMKPYIVVSDFLPINKIDLGN